jgi:replicative DNA helicase
VRTLNGTDRAPSGFAGLDEIFGGFILGRLHLVEGKTGTDKTSLGTQFVLKKRVGAHVVDYRHRLVLPPQEVLQHENLSPITQRVLRQ